MLDMYIIEDTEQMLLEDAPDQSSYIGSISLKQAQALERVWNACDNHGIDFNYFYDMRWTSAEVSTILNCCIECFRTETNDEIREAMTEFMATLQTASEKVCGIAAYTD